MIFQCPHCHDDVEITTGGYTCQSCDCSWGVQGDHQRLGERHRSIGRIGYGDMVMLKAPLFLFFSTEGCTSQP